MAALDDALRHAVDPVSTPHERAPDGIRAAAVLMLFDVRDPSLPLLFLERTGHLRHHAGQIGFPGGVSEADDHSVVDTALREAHEEAGIPADAVEVIGMLPPFMTATSDRWLTPVVGLQSTPITLVPDSFEVARLFSLSLTDLASAPHEVRHLTRDGTGRDVHFYTVDSNVVWGVTGAILHELLQRLERVGSSAVQR
ncbi:MAG: CoA pyrophosphatase [Candidatus Dormibacteraeota bacterium]|nr:CoA pyrophosphatase [Candidatus Dormibacteraeota bacterium]